MRVFLVVVSLLIGIGLIGWKYLEALGAAMNTAGYGKSNTAHDYLEFALAACMLATPIVVLVASRAVGKRAGLVILIVPLILFAIDIGYRQVRAQQFYEENLALWAQTQEEARQKIEPLQRLFLGSSCDEIKCEFLTWDEPSGLLLHIDARVEEASVRTWPVGTLRDGKLTIFVDEGEEVENYRREHLPRYLQHYRDTQGRNIYEAYEVDWVHLDGDPLTYDTERYEYGGP